MSLFSPLLIVCFDQEEIHSLTELARALGYPDAHIVEGGIAQAIEALQSRATSPDYILLDIGARGSGLLEELDEFALHCEPTVRVAVIGSINDIGFYRELRNRGILEYFTRPVQASDVRTILMQAPMRPPVLQINVQQGTVIACMSAASGDGASTLAVNLAYSLAEELKQSVVLVDMDYQFGLIAKSLDLAAPFGIRELFDHPDRGLDSILVEKMLVKYGSNLNIIASPAELRLLPMIRPELIRELVGILRTQFDFVIIDVPHVWTDWTAAALTYSDHTVLVAQLWLRSLTHSARLLTAYQNVGILRKSVSLVINRSGAKFKEAITSQDFERICHQKIESHLNNDVKAVVHAENHGQTIFESGQGILLQQQIRQFAQSMLSRFQGKPMQQAQAVTPGNKRKLLSFLDKG